MLANSGHIQSLLNPPGNPKACFWTGAASEAERGGVARAGGKAQRQLVAALARLDQGPLRRDDARAGRARQRAESRRWRRRPADTSWRNRCRSACATSEGRCCASAFGAARKARPPLLLFNGIGANIELVEPFLDALDGPEAIIFDVPGVGGSPAPVAALIVHRRWRG